MAHATNLVDEVICPNCWERSRPERLLYVSTHRDLLGDFRLGPATAQRFRPTRFLPDGRAVDSRGGICHDLACPRCHLSVPRMLVESPSLFVSIFGGPGVGKSYFLAAMTHRLRKVLSRDFTLNFSDADPEANAVLHAFEDTLFASSASAQVSLPKTDVSGDRYRDVDLDGTVVRYPLPFFFQVSPVSGHPGEVQAAALARTICLYDNAGESFEPGADRPGNPVTQHLARSGCLMFLFDPLQETGFRRRLATAGVKDVAVPPAQQAVLLAEVARRIRLYHRLSPTSRLDCPLIVLVTKFDVWKPLVGDRTPAVPWVRPASGPAVLRLDKLAKVSEVVRDLLLAFAPNIVTTAESFVEPGRITYVPISATGAAPSLSAGGIWEHRAGALNPVWVEVPLLVALAATIPGLVPATSTAPEADA